MGDASDFYEGCEENIMWRYTRTDEAKADGWRVVKVREVEG